MSQTVPTLPSNPFTRFNLTSESGVSSYDNAEMLEMSKMVYHFAQQKASKIMPHLYDVGETNAMFIEQDRFGKFEWTVRSKDVEDTPMTRHTNSTRSATSVKLHAGHIMDRDISQQTRYPITPQVQMELAYSLGRTIDQLIISGLYNPALTYSSSSGTSFAGIPTASTTALPNASTVALTNSGGSDVVNWTTAFVDQLVQDFEEDDWEAGDICVLMPPALRRQLKTIDDFRDAENNQSFSGNENMGVINWLGIKFIYVSKSVEPPSGAIAGTERLASTGGYVNKVGSGGILTSALTSNHAVTLAFTSKAMKFRSCGADGVFSAYAPRHDKSWANQLYTRASYAALRVDDTAVRRIVYKA